MRDPLRVVYCGAGLSGRTSNLRALHQVLELPASAVSVVEQIDDGHRHLHLELCMDDLDENARPAELRGRRLCLSCAPGARGCASDRQRALLESLPHLDGIVFVVDSQRERLEANQRVARRLTDDLATLNRSLAVLPFVVQYNKRDLPNALPVEALRNALGAPLRRGPQIEANATAPSGGDVQRTLAMLLQELARA